MELLVPAVAVAMRGTRARGAVEAGLLDDDGEKDYSWQELGHW